MQGMRAAVFLIGMLTVCAMPAFVGASALRPPMDAKKCPQGSSTERGAAPMTKHLEKGVDPNEVEKFLNTNIYCPNACYDLRVLLTLTYTGLQVDISAVHVCKDRNKAPNDPAQGQKRGCAAGETQPRITISTKDVYSKVIGFNLRDQTVTKSRCDTKAIESATKNFLGGLQTVEDDPKGGESRMQSALDSLRARPDNVPVAAPDPNQQAEILKGFGLTDEQAKEAIANKPEAVKALMACAEGGTCSSEQLQTAAKDVGVALNTDTKDYIERMKAEWDQKNPEGGTVETPNAPQSTGFETNNSKPLPGGRYGQMFNDLEKKYNLPEGYLAGLAKVESAGNPHVCARTSSACGLFQHINSTWRNDSALTFGQPLSPSQRFDPELSAEVTAATAARYQERYGTLMAQSGMQPSTALYSLHNLGESGGQRFMSAYAQNPNLPVSAVLRPIEITNNPSLYGNGNITLAQAEQNMLAKMSGSTNFVRTYTGSPVGGYNGSYANQDSYRQFGSPFSYVNPVYSYPQMAAQPISIGSPIGGTTIPSSGGSSGGQTGTIQPGQTGSLIPGLTQPVQTLPKAVATLIAQPKNPIKGDPITVSWASVGMRTDTPCQVSAGGSFFAQGNSGTRTFQTKSLTASTTVTFALKCTGLSGQLVEQQTSVLVR